MNTTASPSRKEQALELLRANRLDEAKALCEQAARTDNNPGAWYLLGVICGMLGQPNETEACCRKAIEFKPDYADAYCKLGMALCDQGRTADAIPFLHEALKLHPDQAEARFHLGMAQMANKQTEDAITSFREVVRLQPSYPRAYFCLGAALAASGRVDEAAGCFREAARLQPGDVATHAALGNALIEQSDFDGAILAYQQALAVDPRNAEVLNNLGNALSELGRAEEAMAAYQRAIDSAPDYLPASYNLGRLYLEADRAIEAADCFERVLSRNPEHAEAHCNLGVALAQRRRDEAIRHYLRAIELKPDYPEALYNLSNAFRANGELVKAVAHYEKALRSRPNYADARVNLGLVQLQQGNFRDGWRNYAWQWKRNDVRRRPLLPSKLAGGSIEGKAVFLHAEQGLGDELFFLRFVPWLKQRGAGHVVYRASPKLAPLLKRTSLIDRIAAPDEKPGPDELAFSVGDLPLILGMERADQIPPPLALTALPEQVKAIHARLAELGSPPYLGITWRGGTPDAKNTLYKEIPLAAVADCLRNTRATVIALQRLPRAGEVASLAGYLGRPVHDLTAFNENLEQMLALLEAIDHYIGVSNTNMHLRAAVGKTARVLVPAPHDWRWLPDGNSSLWFPGFGVYRQACDDSWDEALRALKQNLDRIGPAAR